MTLDAARTITDADAAAIAECMRSLLCGHEAKTESAQSATLTVCQVREPVEIVTRLEFDVTDANRRATAAVSDVTPDNAALQDMPALMVRALLAHRSRFMSA